mgnify:CR=1 FL=1
MKPYINWILGVLIVFFVAVSVFLYSLGQRQSFDSEWQAVFLSNGTTYFGNVKFIKDDYLKVSNVFYLKSVNQLQGQMMTSVDDKKSESLTLVRLGDEVPQSTSEMLINRDHVLFIEELKSDSSVIKAINDFNKKGNNQ